MMKIIIKKEVSEVGGEEEEGEAKEVLEEVIGVDIGEIMEIIIIIRANNKKINSIIMGMEIMEE